MPNISQDDRSMLRWRHRVPDDIWHVGFLDAWSDDAVEYERACVIARSEWFHSIVYMLFGLSPHLARRDETTDNPDRLGYARGLSCGRIVRGCMADLRSFVAGYEFAHHARDAYGDMIINDAGEPESVTRFRTERDGN